MKKIIFILLILLSFSILGETGGSDEKKEEIKFEDVEKAAKGNDPKSQFDLAVMYYGGNMVAPDPKAGYQWLKRSADNDYPEALFLIGYMNEWGIHMPVDLKAAVGYYEEAAYNGTTNLSYKIALLYYYSLEDPVNAYAWISIAARSGFESAESFRREVYRKLSSSQRKRAEDLSNEIFRRIYKE